MMIYTLCTCPKSIDYNGHGYYNTRKRNKSIMCKNHRETICDMTEMYRRAEGEG